MTGLKVTAIDKWFGGLLMIKEVNSDGSDLVTPDVFTGLSYINNAEVSDETVIETIKNEVGEIAQAFEGDRNIFIRGSFMQSDADLLEFLKEGCRDKYFAVYRHLGKSDGNYIETFFGICKFKPQLNLRNDAKNPSFEIIVMNNENELTISALPEVQASAPIVIPAGKKYVIVSSVIDPNTDNFEIINFTIGNIDLSTKTADAVWGTKVPATSQIRSGKDEGMYNLSYSPDSVMFHKMTIENLETNVIYYAQAKSINTKGTVRLSDIVSFYVGNMIVSPVLVQLLINNINEVITVTERLQTETLTAGIIENSNKDANEKSVGITADSSVITTAFNNTSNGIGTVVDYE